MVQQGVGPVLGPPASALANDQFWAENCIFAVARSCTAQLMGCVALGEVTPHFFGPRNACKFRKCETGIGIHGKWAALEVLGC